MESDEQKISLTEVTQGIENYQAIYMSPNFVLKETLLNEYKQKVLSQGRGEREKIFDVLVEEWRAAHTADSDLDTITTLIGALRVNLMDSPETSPLLSINPPQASCTEDPFDPPDEEISFWDIPGGHGAFTKEFLRSEISPAIRTLITAIMERVIFLEKQVEALRKDNQSLQNNIAEKTNKEKTYVGNAVARMDLRLTKLEKAEAPPKAAAQLEIVPPPTGAACPPPRETSRQRTTEDEKVFILSLRKKNRHRVRSLVLVLLRPTVGRYLQLDQLRMCRHYLMAQDH